MKSLVRLLSVALLLGGAGCAKRFVAVVYEANMQELSPSAEVSETATYKVQRASIRTLTIRLPDDCVNESAATQGMSNAGSNMINEQRNLNSQRMTEGKNTTQLIFRTNCAVWLADLERALIGANYRVISWDTLRKLEQQYNLSTYVAARQLGADAVLVINSLENNEVDSDKVTAVSYRYFRSDPKGNLVMPESLDQRQREIITRFTRARTVDARGGKGWGVGATLDASIVMTNTGESVWIYRRSVIAPYNVESAAKTKVLYRGREIFWRPVEPDGLNVQDVELDRYATSDEMTAVERAERENKKRAVAQEVLNDFMARFTR